MAFLCITACDKPLKEPTVTYGSSTVQMRQETGVPGFSFAKIQQLAENHNQIVKSIVSDVDVKSATLFDDIIVSANSSGVVEIDLSAYSTRIQETFIANNNETHAMFKSYIDEGNTCALRNEHTFGSKVTPYLQRIEDIIKSDKEYAYIEAEINVLMSIAFNDLKSQELVAILIACEVAKKSSHLWLPEELGGLDLIRSMPGSENIQLRGWNWNTFIRNTVCADAFGAFTGFARGAAMIPLLATGPAGAAIIAGQVAVSGAISSAYAAGTTAVSF